MPTDFEQRLASLLAERRELRGYLADLERATALVDLEGRKRAEAAIAQLVLQRLTLSPRIRPSSAGVVAAVVNLYSSRSTWVEDLLQLWRNVRLPGYRVDDWPSSVKARITLLAAPSIDGIIAASLAAFNGEEPA